MQTEFKLHKVDMKYIRNLHHKVLQKTYIDVNRKGTRAAAVTGAIAAAGHSEYERYEVYLDRPFIFAIVHKGTGVPVFIGTVRELKEF